MCGLFGAYSSTLSKWEIDRAVLLGVLSSTRGIDSTGVCVVGRDKGDFVSAVVKDVMNPVTFFSSKVKKDEIEELKSSFLVMGHARAATVGAVNEHNAHPIEEGNIILCHNGTSDALKPKNTWDEYNSDSRELCRLINRSGIDYAVARANTDHMAMSWIDLRTKTLNFFRKDNRPLHFMHTKGDGTIYWASERWMLQAIYQKENNPDFYSPIYLLKTDTIWQFRFGTTSGRIIPLKKMEIKSKKQQKREEKRANWNQVFGPTHKTSNIFCRECRKDALYCDCKQLDTSGTDSPFKKEILCLPKPSTTSVPEVAKKNTVKYAYKGWNGETVPIYTVLERLKKGCFNCQKKTTPVENVLWFAKDELVCKSCYDNVALVNDYIKGSGAKVYESSLVRMQ